MKLAIATFSAALVLATSVSAMVGPYERAINEQTNSGELVSGTQTTVDVSNVPAAPSADWSANGEKTITIYYNAPADTNNSAFEGR